jgi:hypothetical protein
VSAALLDSLRLLAHDAPVLVAVDDAHWLHVSFAHVLQMSLHRSRRSPVGRPATELEDDLGLPQTKESPGARSYRRMRRAVARGVGTRP